MPIPASWVDLLFAKLSVRYGAAFMRQYADLNPDAVKADWAEVLDGTRGESISYALRYLPADKPPNALQFRAICRRAPAPDALALPAPIEPRNPGRVKALIAKALQPAAVSTPAGRVAARLRELAEVAALNEAQRAMLKACERGGEPVPDDQLPESLRGGSVLVF